MSFYKKYKYYYPIFFSLVLVAGILIGNNIRSPFISASYYYSSKPGQFSKLTEIINYIQQEYVDTINAQELVDESITQILNNLDPHSSYIPAEDLSALNEPLQGNFDGIGIEFHIQNDTVMVVSPISGGPSEQVGILAGDKIVLVDGKNIAGIGIVNTDVMKLLRGPSNTKVKVGIFRRGSKKILEFTITRGKIPIYSVDVKYLTADSIGYIKISRFAANTFDEYKSAFNELSSMGMKALVLDLRGNPGGYLEAATQLADEFLNNGKTIVYTQGKSRPKSIYKATSKGDYESNPLYIMIDEGSASASEIVAGAVQDWDRGTIVGRRSFGKGLVQEQAEFPDGSALRLTVSRYYTPTGRSIQKPYDQGAEEYYNEINKRIEHKELNNKDSIVFTDSLKFKTPGGKTVYGGGGIMPDVYIPLDTIGITEYYRQIVYQGLVTAFCYDYIDQNRNKLKKYKSFEDFNAKFLNENSIHTQFITYVSKNGVSFNAIDWSSSSYVLTTQIKAYIARNLYKNEGFYQVLQEIDNTLIETYKLVRKSY
ncbi:MAG TPA: S41 family peptidase [Bacteroidia bacterium]|nr:S41 family peptidase [Bacteroidia bacterium]HNT79858.1 S41 family peptidase [Bacteroidia bacterium]